MYSIRRAKPDDLPVLPTIELAAAQQFLTTPYAFIAKDDDPISAEVDLDHEYVWVVVDSDDHPVGFAIAHNHKTSVHLHEIDVHPDHARQGLGHRLIQTVTECARTQGVLALTLTTFDDVPWNSPYYARLGFRALDSREISQALHRVKQDEAESGLPMENRICMQLDL
jgi:GNAT superfamily N-acetyltransferase